MAYVVILSIASEVGELRSYTPWIFTPGSVADQSRPPEPVTLAPQLLHL